MVKLTQENRKIFMGIINQDLGAIKAAITGQLRKYWEETRIELLKEKGLYEKLLRKEEIKKEIQELRDELRRVEKQLSSKDITLAQAKEYGGELSSWDRVKGANFFGIPIEKELDFEIVKIIQNKVDTEAPAKYLEELASSSLRELAMVGTFEEAQNVYKEFYSLDFRKYGVDIPPRLTEFKENKNLLNRNKLLLMKGDDDSPKRYIG